MLMVVLSFLTLFLFFFFLMIRRPPRSTLFPLHDALPISTASSTATFCAPSSARFPQCTCTRSEEHTSELQSHLNLVCRLLLEKKKKKKNQNTTQNTQKPKDPK